MMMVRVQVVAVCGADCDQNLYRSRNRYYAQSIPAPRRFGEGRCTADQSPLSGGIIRRIVERIVRPQHKSFEGAEAQHDLA